ncbi:MAG: hypothetical protein R3A44_08735 [Caldilineaceae bacterium]
MNSSRRIFLDTSVQVERLIGPPAHKVAIERLLTIPNFGAVTSHYVLMEFQRSVVADYVHVYNQILHSESWELAAQKLRSGAAAQRPRSLGRCLQILTEVMVQSQLDRADALSLLHITIRYGLRRRFWQYVAPIDDAIECDLVAAGTTNAQDGSYAVAASCRKQTAACLLPAFLAENAGKLQILLDYLTAHAQCIKDQIRVEQALRKILLDPRDALGQRSCWPVGDIIIALQVPPDAALWTRDPDFAPLAAALGITLYQPPKELIE